MAEPHPEGAGRPGAVIMTNEQYGALMWTIRRIACASVIDRKGNRRRITRDAMIELARTACLALGWSYALDDVEALTGRLMGGPVPRTPEHRPGGAS